MISRFEFLRLVCAVVLVSSPRLALANHEENCEIPKNVASQPQSRGFNALTCEMNYKSSGCAEYFKENPEAKKHAINCRDFDKWYAPAAGALNFTVGCGAGVLSTAKDLWDGVLDAGKWLGEGTAKVEITLQEKKEFETKCEQSLSCKTLLISTLGLATPPSTEKIQSMKMAEIMRLRERTLGRQERMDEIFRLAEATPGVLSNLGIVAKRSLEETGIKAVCFNRQKQNELLCYGALMVVDPTKYVKWFHRAREAANVAEKESAMAVSLGARLGGESRSAVIKAFEDVKTAANARDLKTPSHFERGPGNTQVPVYTISAQTAESMKAVSAKMKADLEKLGYKVETIRLPAGTVERNGRVFELPERDALKLSAGDAKDGLSRELARTEKWDAARRAEAGFPEQVSPLRVIMDPVETLTSDAYASFMASAAGPTIRLTPHSLLSLKGSGEEAFRHELRHLKAYYDVVSGKPTVYRGSLVAYGSRNLTGDNLGIYNRYFSFDELEGFMLNLKETGARVGREREEFRRAASSKVDVSQQAKSYNEKMSEYRIAANGQARQINGFADSIESGIQSTRMRFQLAQSDRQLKDLMRVNPETPAFPGHRRVEIDLSPSGTRDGTRLSVLIPENQVRMNRPAEVRDYILRYLDDLEEQTKKVRAEAERRKKMIRDDATGIYDK